MIITHPRYGIKTLPPLQPISVLQNCPAPFVFSLLISESIFGRSRWYRHPGNSLVDRAGVSCFFERKFNARSRNTEWPCWKTRRPWTWIDWYLQDIYLKDHSSEDFNQSWFSNANTHVILVTLEWYSIPRQIYIHTDMWRPNIWFYKY